jgi:hypothetical protein
MQQKRSRPQQQQLLQLELLLVLQRGSRLHGWEVAGRRGNRQGWLAL